MNSGQRRRSQSTCNLFCFRDCDQNFDKYTAHTQSDQARPDKISLKKILEIQGSGLGGQRLQRSISHKNLQQWKCDSNRSRQSQRQMKESMLFKKKAKIQNEIEEVNKQMSRLTIQFGQKIHQLRRIKQELLQLKNQ